MEHQCGKWTIGFVTAIVINVLAPKIMLHNGLQRIKNASILCIDHVIIFGDCHSIVVNKFVALQKETRSKAQSAYGNDFDELNAW